MKDSEATIKFEEYLKSIGGLVNGWKADAPPIVTNLCSCGDGWLPLIQELIEDLIALGWDKEISQIKEKFGGLRFYISNGSDEIYDRIGVAENKSYRICEKCGKDGVLRKTESGWYFTACDSCAGERKWPYGDPNGELVKSEIVGQIWTDLGKIKTNP